MPTRHLSIRVEEDALRRLDAEAESNGENRSEAAKRLIEEGLRMRKHPGIYFVDGATGRRARLLRGPDVWEVVRAYLYMLDRDKDDAIERLARDIPPSTYEIQAALRYYADYPEDIDRRIRLDEQLADEALAAEQRREKLVAK